MSTSTIIPTVAVEEDFRARAHKALADTQLRNNFRSAMDSLMSKRAASFTMPLSENICERWAMLSAPVLYPGCPICSSSLNRT